MPYLMHTRQAMRPRHWFAASMILIGLAVIPEVCAAGSFNTAAYLEAAGFTQTAAPW
jgi:hypothetical protein